MKFQKILPVVAVVILLYYVCRQVQIRHKHVEDLTEDRILSQKEVNEIFRYYADKADNRPTDPSKLSNKAKVFVNTVTEYPLTSITDSTVNNYVAGTGLTHLKRSIFELEYVRIALLFIQDYQQKYAKSDSFRSKRQVTKELEQLFRANRYAMEILKDFQDTIDGKNVQGHKPEVFNTMRNTGTLVFGGSVSTKNLDGTHRINMSGPFQTNLIDLIYAYLYPSPDIFTWLQSLFSGKN